MAMPPEADGRRYTLGHRQFLDWGYIAGSWGPATGARDGASVAADRGAQSLTVVQQQLRNLLIAAVRGALPITEEDVRPRGDARDLLTDNLARSGSTAQALDEIQNVILGGLVVAARGSRQLFDPSNYDQGFLARHSSSQVVAPRVHRVRSARWEVRDATRRHIERAYTTAPGSRAQCTRRLRGMRSVHELVSKTRYLVNRPPFLLTATRMPDAMTTPAPTVGDQPSTTHSASDWPRPTTLIDAPRLAARLDVDVFLATETFQRTGSFKFRAAYNVAANVPHPHVITASSGNFGQAIAYACKLFGKRCTIVMPANSARVKIDAVLSHGGRVDLVDTTKVRRADRVARLAAEHPDAYVASAYDDPYVITGNSSLGAELLALPTPPDVVVAPIGGGGLTAGLVQASERVGARMRVIGAEPAIANDAARSLRAGHIVVNESEPQTIADGTRTLSVGRHNWEILEHGIETIVEVPEDAIRDGVRLLFSLANLKAEPTGALGVGALLTSPETFRGRRVCCVVTGGNVDPALYASLIADA